MKQTDIEELQSIVTRHGCLQPIGARTKNALGPQNNIPTLDLSSLVGLIEYDPSEYTFTALAGTPLSDVSAALAENNQYLPFDPPFVEAGATLGGTVAAGLSGSGRYRFGGIRDFLLAIKFLDGNGEIVRSGAKVVKNSAGFDLAKLMVGSLGSLGALVELTIKVFPRPPATTSLQVSFPSISESLAVLIRLTQTPLDLFALDVVPSESETHLVIRIGGLPNSFPARLSRLKELTGEGVVLEGEADEAIWRSVREFHWVPVEANLIKIPLTPKHLLKLDEFLEVHGAIRRYLAGANLAWVAWSGSLDILDRYLQDIQLGGLVVLGSADRVRLGLAPVGTFGQRVKQALDPLGRWVDILRRQKSGPHAEVAV